MNQKQQNNIFSNAHSIREIKSASQKNTAAYLRKLAAGWCLIQTLLLTTPALAQQKPQNELSYSQFLKQLDQGNISKIELDQTTKKAKVFLKGQAENQAPKEVFLFDQNQDLVLS